MLVTAVGAHLSQDWPYSLGILLLFFIALGLLIGIHFVRENELLALALYYAFTFVEGLAIGPLIGAYIHLDGGIVVTQAALTTGLGMAILGTIVYATGLDLRRFSGIMFLATLGLVVFGIISIFTRFVHPTLYAWISLVIFTIWTLIDFARIRANEPGWTPVQLAVQLYLDALNIFLALLQIFGGRGGRSSYRS